MVRKNIRLKNGQKAYLLSSDGISKMHTVKISGGKEVDLKRDEFEYDGY